MNGRLIVGLTAVPAAALAMVLVPAAPASAHPLGNFSVNQYVGLRLHADRVEAVAVVDIAEIPTLQVRSGVDGNGDGTASDGERSAYAAATCADLSAALDARADDQRLVWTVERSEFAYSPGAGGLEVSRLGCWLTAPASLTAPTDVRVDNRYLNDRVGWRELTAAGDGVRIVESSVPSRSVSDELRKYPADLLSSALDVSSATIRVGPGSGSATESGPAVVGGGGDPVSRWMSAIDRRFQDLAGGTLTPLVGLLAVVLAVILGAGHAALPGHGKTILAAYLAGRRGRPRDALTVAGTVTLTHTGGVLALGLLLTAGTAIAGQQIFGWLGLVSGALVLAVGVAMVAGVVRRRGAGHRRVAANHRHGSHSHDQGTHHEDAHDGHSHGQRHASHGSHVHRHNSHDHRHGSHDSHDHRHGSHDHSDDLDDHSYDRRRSGRLGLAGIGLAGGLVPSPSALVVLLAAIGLGRTGFGVLLVVSYGIGMAATLTGAGLLLLALQRRMERAARAGAVRRGGLLARLSRLTAWLHAATPAATAALVLLVGAGLAVRAAAGVL